MRPSVIFGLALLNTVAQAKWQIDETTCKGGDLAFIKEELGQAHKMALAGKTLLETKGKSYYDKFMSDQAQKQILAITKTSASEAIKNVFQKSADLLNEKDGDIVVKFTCNDQTSECQNKQKDVQAHAIQSSGTINLCKSLLKSTESVSELQQDCDVLNLDDISRQSAALTFVHETMHFNQVMKPIFETMTDTNFQACVDYAYGVDDCLDLAAGTLELVSKRASTSTPKTASTSTKNTASTSTQKFCAALKNAASAKSTSSKTTKKTSRADKGCYEEVFTMINADSYAFIAAGAYFTELCKKEIPLQGSASSSRTGSPSA